MVPVAEPDRCPHSLLGAAGGCDIRGAGWRERKSGPCHRLRRLRCLTHGGSFTLYGPGWIPYARHPIVTTPDDQGEIDTKACLAGAAVAVCRGERWTEELLKDEAGPAGRTQRRWVRKVAAILGLDGHEVTSDVVSELGLDMVELMGSTAQRVTAVARRAADHTLWLRLAATLDLVGAYGPVAIVEGLHSGRVAPARGRLARALRGPP